MARPEGGTLLASNATAHIAPDGTFAINGLAPGAYELLVRTNRDLNAALASGTIAKDEVAATPLTIGGEDIDGARITTSKGVRLAGQVVFEGSGGGRDLPMRISAAPEGDRVMLDAGYRTLTSDTLRRCASVVRVRGARRTRLHDAASRSFGRPVLYRVRSRGPAT